VIKRRPVWWRVVIAGMVAVLLASIPFVFATASEIRTIASTVLFPEDVSEKGACPNGYVALTFDDGPDPVITPQIAQALRNGGARGTFFVVGAKAGAHPEVIQKIRAQGMEVANHTYDHPFLDELMPDRLRDEMIATSEIIDRGGPAPALFRAPYGRTNDMVRDTASALGMTEVLWTLDSNDYEHATPDHMVRVAGRAKHGDVLLFHDIFPSTVAAIPGILDNLRERGLCSGRIVPSGTPTQAWLDYDGSDRAYYSATTARW
jgi:peptidoglycan-N-acetylglucosamine deacetylase